MYSAYICNFARTLFDVYIFSMKLTKIFAHSQYRMQIFLVIYKQTAQEKYKIKHTGNIKK